MSALEELIKRRKYERFKYNVTVYQSSGRLLGESLNISAGGIFLAPIEKVDLEASQTYSVTIRPIDPDWPVVTALAEIRWVLGSDRGYGLEIYPSNPKAMEELMDRIKQRCSLEFEEIT
jgi:hypothetical protein